MVVAHNWLPQLSFPTLNAPLRDQLHDLATQDYPHITRVVLLLWSIWKTRNGLVFNNDVANPMGTLLRAKRSWAEWKLRTSSSPILSSSTTSTHSPHRLHSNIPHFIRWHPPAGGNVKLNCDGAKSSRGASAGFVLRSWTGGFIMAGTRYLEQAPVLVAEATAVRDGLKSAIEAGWKRIQVEGDNKVVISAICGNITPPWQIAAIIEDTRTLSRGCDDITFTHIYRESNMAADWVAKFGCHLRSVSLNIFDAPPSRDFLFLLADDNLDRSFARGES